MQGDEKKSYWSVPAEAVFQEVGSQSSGLTVTEAKRRLNEDGPNTIQKKKKDNRFMFFLKQFNNPIVIILLVATGVSALTGEWVDVSIILLIILFSAALSFYQEYSAGNAIEKLRERVQATTLVRRDNQQMEIPSTEVVVGDIVMLSAGSLIPADSIILDSLHFFVNQSILTGESLPTEKFAGIVTQKENVQGRTNVVLMGTNVHSGSATVLVVKTGDSTEYGQLAEHLSLRAPETEFESGVRKFGYLLTQIMLILTLIVFAVNVILDRPAIESLLFSVALAVGITPQLLPAIISITLSKGSRVMAKAGVIVRRLAAIENLGSMDVLCTDKTGTLTEGTIVLNGMVDTQGRDSAEVLQLAYLNATLQTGMANSIDAAISERTGITSEGFKKVGEIPFDFSRERLSVVVQEKEECTLIAKGALDRILEVCTKINIMGEDKEKNSSTMEKIHDLYGEWSGKGIRVLGVAKKAISWKAIYDVGDEQEMTFMGFLLLSDEVKAGASQVITNLAENGVSLRVITGDNKLIALKTAAAVNMKVTGVLTGNELRDLSEGSLLNRVEDTNLFVEVDPNQKERILLALKKRSHIVGFMGDGINDLPALHAADVSITVDNAVDVAKETADFVLLEKDLKVLNKGVELGRKTFTNTLKYILLTTSANFGNMFSMAGVSLLLPFFPLLPKQILLINFLTDFPALTIADDAVDAETLVSPRRWDVLFIRNYMFTFGFFSSAFDYLATFIIYQGFQADQEIFQSSWFIFSVLTELLILMVMRTGKRFYQSRPAPILLYSSLGVGFLTFLLPYLPFHQIFNLEPIPFTLLFILILITIIYALLAEVLKHYFYKSKRPL